jgi:hypothetical protein
MCITFVEKWFERNAAKVKRRRMTELPSLRRHYPGQVLRVFSQHLSQVVLPCPGAPRETEILNIF